MSLKIASHPRLLVSTVAASPPDRSPHSGGRTPRGAEPWPQTARVPARPAGCCHGSLRGVRASAQRQETEGLAPWAASCIQPQAPSALGSLARPQGSSHVLSPRGRPACTRRRCSLGEGASVAAGHVAEPRSRPCHCVRGSEPRATKTTGGRGEVGRGSHPAERSVHRPGDGPATWVTWSPVRRVVAGGTPGLATDLRRPLSTPLGARPRRSRRTPPRGGHSLSCFLPPGPWVCLCPAS